MIDFNWFTIGSSNLFQSSMEFSFRPNFIVVVKKNVSISWKSFFCIIVSRPFHRRIKGKDWVKKKHNGLEQLNQHFLREKERAIECEYIMCWKLLLRIFELKIKFSFYDLPCSFPIKHFISLIFFPCWSIYLLHSTFRSLCLMFSFLPQRMHVCNECMCVCIYFFNARSNARIPDFATHKKKKQQIFDWPKFLGTSAFCNYEIKDKQRPNTEYVQYIQWQ